MKQQTCIICKGVTVLATDDDRFPKCDKCQSDWSLALAVQAIMAGEMDHLLPIEGESDRDDDE